MSHANNFGEKTANPILKPHVGREAGGLENLVPKFLIGNSCTEHFRNAAKGVIDEGCQDFESIVQPELCSIV